MSPCSLILSFVLYLMPNSLADVALHLSHPPHPSSRQGDTAPVAYCKTFLTRGSGSRDSTVVRALTTTNVARIRVEFVVGSHPCSERFFCRYCTFPLSLKSNICKFQFDLDYCQVLYHVPLTWQIAPAVPLLMTLNQLLYLVTLL